MPKKHKDISNSKIYEPMRFWWVYFAISLSVLIPGVSSLIKNGLKLGIDFTGGSSISWIAPSLTKESIIEAFENQNETLKHLKGFQKYIAIIAIIISFSALIISIFK